MQQGAPAGDQPLTLLANLQKVLAQGQTREQENVDLRQALGQVITALNEDMRLNAELRNAYSCVGCLILLCSTLTWYMQHPKPSLV
jgi:hypothetical protein